jgi:uncharacterized protein (TIGR00369 family)
MSIASQAQALLVDVNRPGNVVRSLWDRLAAMPGGKYLFSVLIGQAAPYSGSIGARVVELREGYAKVTLADRRKVRNHLRSVHAVALVNLCEITGNVALAYALPDDARFILAGLSIQYLRKARGTITGECQCPVPRSSLKTTYHVPVVLRDESGQEVARATLESLVGPKQKKEDGRG